jgi:cytochrome c6
MRIVTNFRVTMVYPLVVIFLLLAHCGRLATASQKRHLGAFGAGSMANRNGVDAASPAMAFLLMVASSAVVQCPAPASAGDVGKGEQLFANNCAGCHIGGSNLVNEKKTLKKEALLQYGVGLDPASIKGFLTNSLQHKKLVFFRVDGGKLTEDQWEDAATYVSDQATGEKWL